MVLWVYDWQIVDAFSSLQKNAATVAAICCPGWEMLFCTYNKTQTRFTGLLV